jgi:hypothetical protein
MMNQDDIDAAVTAIVAMRPQLPCIANDRSDTQVRRQLNDHSFEKDRCHRARRLGNSLCRYLILN